MHNRLILGLMATLSICGNAMAADLAAGKKMFEQSCAYCHNTSYEDKFGPGLAGIIERRDAVWLNAFLLDPAKMIKEDEYAQTLKESNKYGLTMPSMPEMKDEANRLNVIEYLKTIE